MRRTCIYQTGCSAWASAFLFLPNTHLICAHGHLDVLLADFIVPNVADIVARQFQYVCWYVFKHSHDVQGNVVVYFIAQNLLLRKQQNKDIFGITQESISSSFILSVCIEDSINSGKFNLNKLSKQWATLDYKYFPETGATFWHLHQSWLCLLRMSTLLQAQLKTKQKWNRISRYSLNDNFDLLFFPGKIILNCKALYVIDGETVDLFRSLYLKQWVYLVHGEK